MHIIPEPAEVVIEGIGLILMVKGLLWRPVVQPITAPQHELVTDAVRQPEARTEIELGDTDETTSGVHTLGTTKVVVVQGGHEGRRDQTRVAPLVCYLIYTPSVGGKGVELKGSLVAEIIHAHVKVLPAKPQVQGQLGCDLPIVLEVTGIVVVGEVPVKDVAGEHAIGSPGLYSARDRRRRGPEQHLSHPGCARAVVWDFGVTPAEIKLTSRPG